MKDIKEIIKNNLNEGYNNTYQFGDYSMNGKFIDYFGNKLNVGDKVVFIAQDFKDSKDFYRAEVAKLITDNGGTDYIVLSKVESPYMSSKIKDGSKKRTDLCVKLF